MLARLASAFGLLLIGLAWLGYDHYRPWPSFHSEAVAIAGAVLLTTGVFLAAPVLISLPPVVLGVGLLAVLPWLQFAAGIQQFAGDALLTSIFLCVLALSIATGHFQCAAQHGPETVPGHCIALWLAAMASATIGLLQWLGLQEAFGMYVVQTNLGERAMGNLSQPNQLATLLLMGMIASLMMYEKNLIGRAPFLLCIGFMSSALVMTESRTGLLNVVVLAAFLTFKRAKHPMRMRIAPLWTWVVLCLIASGLVGLASEFLLIGEGRGMPLMESNGRGKIWEQMWHGIAKAPWTGYGWNNTPAVHAAGALKAPGSLTYTHAHNVVLDLIAWNGVPIGLALVGACLWWGWTRLRAVDQPLPVLAAGALLCLVVHSLLEYPFAYAYFLVPAGLLIGVVEASLPGHRMSVPRIGVLSLAAGLSLAGGLVGKEYVLIEEDFRMVRFENLRIGHTPAEYDPPDVFLLTHMGAMLKSSRMKPYEGMPPEDIELLRATSSRFAFGALALRYALALGMNGESEEASRQMSIIKAMYGTYYYSAAREVVKELAQSNAGLRLIALP